MLSPLAAALASAGPADRPPSAGQAPMRSAPPMLASLPPLPGNGGLPLPLGPLPPLSVAQATLSPSLPPLPPLPGETMPLGPAPGESALSQALRGAQAGGTVELAAMGSGPPRLPMPGDRLGPPSQRAPPLAETTNAPGTSRHASPLGRARPKPLHLSRSAAEASVAQSQPGRASDWEGAEEGQERGPEGALMVVGEVVGMEAVGMEGVPILADFEVILPAPIHDEPLDDLGSDDPAQQPPQAAEVSTAISTAPAGLTATASAAPVTTAGPLTSAGPSVPLRSSRPRSQTEAAGAAGEGPDDGRTGVASTASRWRVVRGRGAGTTQAAIASERLDGPGMSVWAHPVCMELATDTMCGGWPKLAFTILRRVDVTDYPFAYGMCALPCSAGTHVVDVACWAPGDGRTKVWEEAGAAMGAGGSMLPNAEAVFRRRGLLGTTLETRPAGKIVLRLSVMTANMDAVLVNTLQQAEARRVQRRAGAAMLRSDVPAVVGGKVLSGGYARDQEDEESETEGLRFVRSGRAARLARARAKVMGHHEAREGREERRPEAEETTTHPSASESPPRAMTTADRHRRIQESRAGQRNAGQPSGPASPPPLPSRSSPLLASSTPPPLPLPGSSAPLPPLPDLPMLPAALGSPSMGRAPQGISGLPPLPSLPPMPGPGADLAASLPPIPLPRLPDLGPPPPLPGSGSQLGYAPLPLNLASSTAPGASGAMTSLPARSAPPPLPLGTPRQGSPLRPRER